MGEVFFIASLIIFLILPWVLIGLAKGGWAWLKVMSSIGLIIVIAEVWSKIVDGKTISQKFWAFSLENELMAWAILGCYMIGSVSLCAHLAWKMLTKKKPY